MADWTADLLRERKPGTEGDGTANDLLDVGTGNATFLLVLADRGYAALTGTDYSKASIELAKAVVSGRGMSQVVLEEDDLLNTKLTKQYGPASVSLASLHSLLCMSEIILIGFSVMPFLHTQRFAIMRRFDVITDKGTYDAIGLSENGQADKAQYRVAVWDLLKSDGILVITSCNNTADELKVCSSRFVSDSTFLARCSCLGSHGNASQSRLMHASAHDLHVPAWLFAKELALCVQEQFSSYTDGRRFVYIDHVRTYPTFRFGGIEGTKVCTVAFEKDPVRQQ